MKSVATSSGMTNERPTRFTSTIKPEDLSPFRIVCGDSLKKLASSEMRSPQYVLSIGSSSPF